MDRRRLIAGTGAAVAGGLAGCLETIAGTSAGNEDDGSADSPSDGENDPDEPDPDGQGELGDSNPEDQVVWDRPAEKWDVEIPDDASASETVRIGSGDDSHKVAIIAESEASFTADVVVRGADGGTVREQTVHLSRAEYAVIHLHEPQDYTIELRRDDVEWTVEVEEGFVDCNASTQSVLLRESGQIEERTITTLMGCR